MCFDSSRPGLMNKTGPSWPKPFAGSFHSGEILRLKNTLSPVLYVLTNDRVLYCNSFFNLLLDSDSIKTFLAACNVVRYGAKSIGFIMAS